jgi:NADH:ubiquinone oxidoreductase subunit 6 (subunit J)
MLIGCFGAIALLYFSLGAELVAASQILIYAVGITLVVIFAIMLLAGTLDNAEEPKEDDLNQKEFASSFHKIFSIVLLLASLVLTRFAFALGNIWIIIIGLGLAFGAFVYIHKVFPYFFRFALPFFSFILMSYSFIGLSSALTPSPPFPPARVNALIQYIEIARQKTPFMPNSLEMIGNVLLSEQVLAFELVSVLLLIAFIGAILLSKKQV